MGPIDKFLDMLKIDDEFDNDYIQEDDTPAEKPAPLINRNDNDEEEKTVKRSGRNVNSNNRTRKGSGNMDVVRIEPTSVEDGRRITDLLLENKVVFLDLDGIDMNLAQRIIDFTSGATYAIDGTLQQMSKYTFVIAPAAVNVSGDFQDAAMGNTSVTF